MAERFLSVLTDVRKDALAKALERCVASAGFFRSWENTNLAVELRRAYDETIAYAEHFPASLLERMYDEMLFTRLFYKEIRKHLKKGGDGTIAGPAFSGTWHEAIGVGAVHAMHDEDFLGPTHRDMAATIARKERPVRIWENHLGKLTGPTFGYDGNIHFPDFEHRNFGFQISTMAVNAVLAPGPVIPANWEKAKKLGRALEPDERIAAVAIFGDGAASNGMVHEGMNLAKVWKIPSLFVVEDNYISLSTSPEEQHGGIVLANRGLAYEMPSATLDGMDVVLVHLGTRLFLTFSRRTEHPSLLHLECYRECNHNDIEDGGYVKKGHPKLFAMISDPKNDPLYRARIECEDASIFTEELREVKVGRFQKEIQDAYQEALAKPSPTRDRSLLRPGLIDSSCAITKELALKSPRPANATRELSLREAFREGLREEFRANYLLRYFGEDVRDPKGGVLSLTRGLSEEFSKQVINAPLGETAIAGNAIGSGFFGYPAFGEFQFMPFTWSAGEPLFTFAPTRPAMVNRGCNCTFVGPFGKVPSSNAYHSSCIEVHFAALEGMKVLCPSTPAAMKGMVKSAARDPDVCYIMVQICELDMRGPVPESEYFTPLGVADIRRSGSDITLITYGPLMIREALMGAELLEKEGISLEVIDLQTIHPWDKETVFASVKKTGRAMIMHEASKSFHVGAELAASIGEELSFYALKSRIVRLTAPDTPVPFHPNLEDVRLPEAADVVEKAKLLMEES